MFLVIVKISSWWTPPPSGRGPRAESWIRPCAAARDGGIVLHELLQDQRIHFHLALNKEPVESGLPNEDRAVLRSKALQIEVQRTLRHVTSSVLPHTD